MLSSFVLFVRVFLTGLSMQLLRSEPQPPSAWRRTPNGCAFRPPESWRRKSLDRLNPNWKIFRPGYRQMYQPRIAGEKAKQVNGFLNLAGVLLISLVGIYPGFARAIQECCQALACVCGRTIRSDRSVDRSVDYGDLKWIRWEPEHIPEDSVQTQNPAVTI